MEPLALDKVLAWVLLGFSQRLVSKARPRGLRSLAIEIPCSDVGDSLQYGSQGFLGPDYGPRAYRLPIISNHGPGKFRSYSRRERLETSEATKDKKTTPSHLVDQRPIRFPADRSIFEAPTFVPGSAGQPCSPTSSCLVICK